MSQGTRIVWTGGRNLMGGGGGWCIQYGVTRLLFPVLNQGWGMVALGEQSLGPLNIVCGKGMQRESTRCFKELRIHLPDCAEPVRQVKARVGGGVPARGTHSPRQLGPVGPLS